MVTITVIQEYTVKTDLGMPPCHKQNESKVEQLCKRDTLGAWNYKALGP